MVLDFIGLLGMSIVVAVISGITMGLYLSAINKFVPVRQLLKSYINNIVICFSFFLPVLIYRYSESAFDPITLQRWFGAIVLFAIFSMTADTSNWLISNYVTKKKLQDR